MFKNTTELINLGTRNGRSKSGEPYQILVVGNPAKYENYEFFVGQDVELPTLALNEPITVEIEMSKRGYNLVPTLKGVSKTTAPVNSK